MKLLRIFELAVVLFPLVQKISFTAIGIPSNGRNCFDFLLSIIEAFSNLPSELQSVFADLITRTEEKKQQQQELDFGGLDDE